MGFWELDHHLYDVHHLMVLCFHLQHPSLYSPEGLRGEMQLLVQFVEQGVTPQEMRQRISQAVDAGTRTRPIKGKTGAVGAYEYPVHWTMTARDVSDAGLDNYYPSVDAWAAAVLADLRASKNLD